MDNENIQLDALRKMSLPALCKWIGSHNEKYGRGYILLGQYELQRRLDRPHRFRATLALVLASLALFISLFDLGLKIADRGHQPGDIDELQVP